MKISSTEVLHVAHLARLSIDETDLAAFSEQLGGILEYVAKLSGIDTSGVTPTAHAVDMANAFRNDKIHQHLQSEEALANAPEADDGLFVVPKIIE